MAMESVFEASFTVADYVLFVLILLVSILIGIYSAFRKDNSTTEQFLVGGKSMPVLPVAISLVGGAISAISVLGNASEIYLHGSQLTMNLLGAFWGMLILRNLILPILYPTNIISLYEYIELRFGSVYLRKISATTVLASSLFYLGACMYTPSIALSSVTNISSSTSIIVMGLVCTFYITIGGVQAVVYTDVFQTLTMLVGVLTTIAIVCADLGGVDQVRQTAMDGGRLDKYNFDFNPLVRHTFWSVQILGVYFVSSSIGLSQGQFQRFVSVKNLEKAKLLSVLFYPGLFILWSLFYFTGLTAYAAYEHCDPYTSGRIENPDQIIPFLVADKLASLPGLCGLFIAGVYGGVLSTISSSTNSMACMLWEDFLKDINYFKNMTDRGATRVIKILSALCGLVGIGLGLLMGQLGTIFQAVYSITGAIKGPVDGIFIAGIFAPWVNLQSVVVGFITALVFNIWLIVGQTLTGAGSEPNLPLYTDGCPENQNVTTTLFSTSYTTTVAPVTIQSGLSEKTFYDLSYCYVGTFGILIVYFISSILSLVTGVKKPQDVNPLYVNKFCRQVHIFLYNKLCKNTDNLPNNDSTDTIFKES